MPKLPYVITLEYPPERGGVGRYLCSLVEASQGEIQVIVPLGRGMGGERPNVTAVPMFRDWWPRWWPIVQAFRRLKEKASVVLISHVLPVGTAAMIAKWFGGPPYALLFHGLDIRLLRTSPWKIFLAKWIIRYSSALIVNSKATERELRDVLGVSGEVYVLTPGVTPLPILSREDARIRLGIPTEELIVLAIGRLVERKGFDMLIRASLHLPTADKIRIVIIGGGPERKELEKIAESSPHRVQFISTASDEHIAEWYAASDVFCLPVKDDPSDFEGFGIVFLEASLAGLPIVAGRAGGVEEAVADRESGLLVNGSDPKEIARALVMLLGDPEHRRRLGESGRERVLRDFRWEDRWSAFKKLIDTLV